MENRQKGQEEKQKSSRKHQNLTTFERTLLERDERDRQAAINHYVKGIQGRDGGCCCEGEE